VDLFALIKKSADVEKIFILHCVTKGWHCSFDSFDLSLINWSIKRNELSADLVELESFV
jgi:hypothetical protein